MDYHWKQNQCICQVILTRLPKGICTFVKMGGRNLRSNSNSMTFLPQEQSNSKYFLVHGKVNSLFLSTASRWDSHQHFSPKQMCCWFLGGSPVPAVSMLPAADIASLSENVWLLDPSRTHSEDQVMSHWSLFLLIHVIHASESIPENKVLGGPKADDLHVASSPLSSLDCEVLCTESPTPSF